MICIEPNIFACVCVCVTSQNKEDELRKANSEGMRCVCLCVCVVVCACVCVCVCIYIGLHIYTYACMHCQRNVNRIPLNKQANTKLLLQPNAWYLCGNVAGKGGGGGVNSIYPVLRVAVASIKH